MIVGPYMPKQYPNRGCSANTSDGAAREWDYGWGGVQIEDSTFSQNRAGTEVMEASAGSSNSGGGFGGALHATNFKITVTSTTFVNNWAGSSGGAAFLAAGSARLSLLGTTVLDGNTAVETGSAIYSASGGEIAILDRTLIEFVPMQPAPGLTILTGGKLVYGAQGPRMPFLVPLLLECLYPGKDMLLFPSSSWHLLRGMALTFEDVSRYEQFLTGPNF